MVRERETERKREGREREGEFHLFCVVHIQTYKTHLEGKAHKKKLQQGSELGEGGGGGEKSEKMDSPYYCPLCEIQCTSNDSYEAHIRGSRHTKVTSLSHSTQSYTLHSLILSFFLHS